MSFEKLIEDNLTELNIITLIPENGRVRVHHGHIKIEPDKVGRGIMSTASWLINAGRRWYFNDNRISGISAISDTVQQSFNLIEEIKTKPDFTMGTWYTNTFLQRYDGVIKGLTNYKNTYSHDAYIVSRCELLVNKIKKYLKDGAEGHRSFKEHQS